MEINRLGTFDVLFDDGTTERNVPRHRIKLSPGSPGPQPGPGPPPRTGYAEDSRSVEGDDVSAITSLPSLAQSQSLSEVSHTVKRRWKRKMDKQQKHLQKMSEMKQQRDVIETVAAVSVMEKLKASKAGASRRSVDGSSVASSVGSLPSSPVNKSRKDSSVVSRSGRTSSSTGMAMGGSRQSSSRLGLTRSNTGLSSILSDEDEFDNLSVNSNDSMLSMGSADLKTMMHVSPTVPPPSSEW